MERTRRSEHVSLRHERMEVENRSLQVKKCGLRAREYMALTRKSLTQLSVSLAKASRREERRAVTSQSVRIETDIQQCVPWQTDMSPTTLWMKATFLLFAVLAATASTDCPSDACEQPKDRGSCNRGLNRYFYNCKTERCETFKYGGCGGNDNNFKNRQQCEETCGAGIFRDMDPCEQRKVQGNCGRDITRYYYDKKANKCKRFTWRGCVASKNNFKTMQQCRKKCKGHSERSDASSAGCELPRDPGSCGRNLTRYYFNTKRGRCAKFSWAGCSTNKNNFLTLEDCLKHCCKACGSGVCDLPKDRGSCDDDATRFFFNWKTEKCEPFTYGGCGGNDNNFHTRYMCEKKCGIGDDGGKDVCRQRKVNGNCGQRITRYYYDQKNGRCEKFVWKGCVFNDNNFKSYRECQLTCGGGDEDVCSLPRAKGPCKKRLERFYYDPKSERCHKFIFGGCEGNGNNFKSQKACEKKCCKCNGKDKSQGPATGLCLLPRKEGDCDGRIRAYYYDVGRKGCFPFMYTGCGGNSNNFVSAYQCKKVCMEYWR